MFGKKRVERNVIVQRFDFQLKEILVWTGIMDGIFASAEDSRSRR